MDLNTVASQLSEIERQALLAIGEKPKSFEEIASETKMHIDSLRRALQWLKQKKLISLDESKSSEFSVKPEANIAERKIINALEKEQTIQELRQKTGLDEKETGFCLGKLKSLNILSVTSGKVFLTEVGKIFQTEKLEEEKIISKILNGELKTQELSEHEKRTLNELVKRKIAAENHAVSVSAGLTSEGIEAKKLLAQVTQRQYNVFDPVPRIFAGKKQPYVRFLEHIKQKLVEMGFTEMKEQLVTQEFYNFDVLFQPQNHPARTWTDTYRLKRPQFGKLPDKKIVQAIKYAHKTGGKTLSKGWGYEWSEKIASRLMPNAHGTSADARQMVKGVTNPGKYFVVNRCYRPDVLDATHLVEFNQLDGFIVGDGLNFPKLLGILKELTSQVMGPEEIKFSTGYFPFTEPSCELYVKHEKLGWIEIGGAGIFRPEITENLGIKERVIAFGLGIDRLAMVKLEINNIRDLFSQDLEWLRNRKII